MRRDAAATLPAETRAAMPPPLGAIAALPEPKKREEPSSLSYAVQAGEASIQALQRQMTAAHQARLDAERMALESTFRREMDLRRAAAAQARWRAHDEILRRYQREATRLRLAIARLEAVSGIAAEVPEARARQQEQLALRRAELEDLQRRRQAELDAVDRRIREEMAAEDRAGEQAVAAALRDLEEELRSQREAALQTARQELEERLELAREALQYQPESPPAPPPPTPLRPASTLATLPTTARSSRPLAHLRELERQRARLQQVLREETRRRVLGIAKREHLRVEFSAQPNLPDRTAFFARELRVPN
ncbi:MAG: hypothetical protein QHJ73_07395 [Armatimonadota bacterium]|nr:hypothetical protein [Armatimonadota bacterium]